MKFRITLKDPDGVYDSLERAVEDSIQRSVEVIGTNDFDPDELELVHDARREKYQSFIKQWVSDGEYVTVEFDTEAGTAMVVGR